MTRAEHIHEFVASLPKSTTAKFLSLSCATRSQGCPRVPKQLMPLYACIAQESKKMAHGADLTRPRHLKEQTLAVKRAWVPSLGV
jgi:hypothetical protein